MIEHKPAGFVRQKMRRHGDGSVAGQATRQQAVEARRRLFAATKEIDALMKAGIKPARVSKERKLAKS
jgi:hypothetical protein